MPSSVKKVINNSYPKKITLFFSVPSTSSSQLDPFHDNQNIFIYHLHLKQRNKQKNKPPKTKFLLSLTFSSLLGFLLMLWIGYCIIWVVHYWVVLCTGGCLAASQTSTHETAFSPFVTSKDISKCPLGSNISPS